MKFYFNENEEQNILKVYQDILVVFDKEGCYAQNGGGDFSVYLKDSFLSIDVDVESRRVGSFGGYIDIFKSAKICDGEQIDFKKAKTGVLYVSDCENLLSGVGVRIDFSVNCTVDRQNKAFIVGNLSKDLPLNKFFKNGYCQIKDGNLLCLIFTDDSLVEVTNNAPKFWDKLKQKFCKKW